MQEAEEQDTCRICSAPAEEDQPLFHPCKCSGTIRYIHQDCLTTWLSHSKKKNCDVCKHPYSFTKVYADNMPNSLPPILLVKKLIQQTLFALLFGIRGIVVGIIWLAALPWATVWTWRMYFSMGESTAWWISGKTRPPSNHTDESPFYYNIHIDKSLPQPTTFIGRLTTHPVWTALSADIFTGQIIASLIVLTFVAVFLLREWISQNARPGIFDDDDLLADDGQAPRPDPRPAPAAPPPPHPLEEALARRQAEALRALEGMRDAPDGRADGEGRRHTRRPPLRKGKGRRGRNDRTDPEMRATTRRRIADEIEEGRIRRTGRVRRAKADRRAMDQGSPARIPLQVDPTFQFTFALDPPRPRTPPPAIPYTFDGVKWVPSASLENQPTPEADAGASAHPSSLNQRRPPLPASSPPGLASASSSSSSSQALAESSRMATYRAPEELEIEAGSSQLPNEVTFDVDEDEDMDNVEITEEEFAQYFEESHVENDRPETPSDDETDKEVDDEGWRQEAEEEDHVHIFENEDENEEPMEEFVFDAWEAAHDEDADNEELPAPGDVPVVNLDIVVQPPGAQGAAQNPPAIEIPPELAEEMEGNAEDDMEGAMEAIGMRGPIYGVLQNAALMIFVLDTAIGIGIWIPFTLGKTAALLSLDPPRALKLLHLPIQAIRVITDPFVDGAAFLIFDILAPSYIRAAIRLAKVFVTSALWIIGLLFGRKVVDDIIVGSTKLGSSMASMAENPLDRILAWTTAAPAPPSPQTPQVPSFFAQQQDKLWNITEPYFETLGRNVRITWLKSHHTWEKLAFGDGPLDRAFAIVIGYTVVGVILALYLNLFTVGNARTAGRAVRNAIRQQLLVLKVAAFIFIELISFPLSCGLVLDICTVWMFPEANFLSRVAFFTQAPLTAIFYHWLAGTMFMYAFAMVLSGCRSVMRPGAMWFIKDPQDVNSHPIKEILDRSTITQLRKICVSGVMYSCVVACAVGSVAGLLKLGNKSIMPIRWKNREPLSNVPVDLLFLHIVLPYTMHYFRPKKALKAGTTVIWKLLAKQLRLTSYFFTGRYPDEEYSRGWAFFSSKNDVNKNATDGAFRRVPCTDNVALPRDMHCTVGVTADGQPVDDAARELMMKQNMEVLRAGRHVKDEFVVVYLPPHFRYRIFCFIGLIWIIGAFALGITVALPILLGRRFFEMFTTRNVHDGYSLMVGFYLLWCFYLVGSSIDRLDRRRQRTSGERHRGQDLPIVVMKRGAIWVVKSLYMTLCLGVLIPTLISFVIELYIVLPIRFTLDPEMTPRIRVVDTWALGLIYVKIALHANRIQPPNRFSRGIQHIIHNGWTKSDPVQATREIIGPIVGGLLGMILFPGFVFRALQYLFPNMPIDDKFIFMHIYPGIFMLAGLIRSAVILYGLLKSWSQSVRDKEFLVEMRLRNHEPEKENPKRRESTLGLAKFKTEEVVLLADDGHNNTAPVVQDEEADDEGVWEEVVE